MGAQRVVAVVVMGVAVTCCGGGGSSASSGAGASAGSGGIGAGGAATGGTGTGGSGATSGGSGGAAGAVVCTPTMTPTTESPTCPFAGELSFSTVGAPANVRFADDGRLLEVDGQSCVPLDTRLFHGECGRDIYDCCGCYFSIYAWASLCNGENFIDEITLSLTSGDDIGFYPHAGADCESRYPNGVSLWKNSNANPCVGTGGSGGGGCPPFPSCACKDCVSSCSGLPGCCWGSGCICESQCS